jgi:hypothetical protein
MSVRVVGLGSIVLACGCELVSGLASLEVDASSPMLDASDDDDDVAPSDVTSPDVPTPIEAGTGGYALSTSGGCATSASIQLSNLEFTLTLWLRVDAVPTNSNDVLPIVWNGGRGPSEQGWSLDLTAKGLIFCVADQNGFTCTTPYGITTGHLVHIGVVSPYNGQASGRSMEIYALDRSAGATTHTSVATATGAQGNWSSSAPLTIGGAQVGQSCTSPSSVTVDRIHLFTAVVPVGIIDSTAATTVCSGNGVLFDFELDEGTGTVAKSCTATASSLSWPANSKIGFVISPFP